MQDFLEERLELGIVYGAEGGPRFDSTSSISDSGHVFSNLPIDDELGSWSLGDKRVLRTELEYLLTFFRRVRGDVIPFRWKNYADYIMDKQDIGTGDAIEKDFQILKTYGAGDDDPYIRFIQKPVTGTGKVYLDDVLQSSGYTIDYTTGIVTFSVAPGVGVVVAVECEYDTPVRFATKRLPTRFDAFQDSDKEVIFYLPAVPIEETRV